MIPLPQSLLSLAFLLVASPAFAQQQWTVGQTVQTSSGPVDGHAASVNTGVSVYLGIPFAAPPVGDLRWTEPQAFKSDKPLNGSKYGFICPQSLTMFGGGNVSNIAHVNLTASALPFLTGLENSLSTESEDCLTLNIWTKPQGGTASEKKAVLVWIYGGAYTTGSSANPAYDGQYIVEQEGGSDFTQNLGLLDQRLALEWVRDNIAAFGGDVDRITLFGQSAGGSSVDHFSWIWVDDPIVAGTIPESGTAFGLPIQTPTEGNTAFDAVAKFVGCSSTELACLRKIDTKTLVTAIANTSGTFGPTEDGKTVFSNYTERALAGNFIKKPLLIGNTNYEAGLFKVLYALADTEFPDSYWDAFNNDTFVCPAALRANYSLSAGLTTWRYRWFGAFPNTQLTSVPFSGAWHASEIPILFDTAPVSVLNNTAAEIDIGNWLRGVWAAFAKDPEKGLINYGGGWPTYDPSANTLVQLAYSNMTGTNLARGDTYDSACASYAQGAVPVSPPTSNSTTNPGNSTNSTTSSTTASASTAVISSSGTARMICRVGYGWEALGMGALCVAIGFATAMW